MFSNNFKRKCQDENMDDDSQSEGSSIAEDVLEVLENKLDELLDRFEKLEAWLKQSKSVSLSQQPCFNPLTIPQ